MVSVLQNIHGRFRLKTSSVIRVSLTLTFILSADILETLAILENFFNFFENFFLILFKLHKLKFVGDKFQSDVSCFARSRGINCLWQLMVSERRIW